MRRNLCWLAPAVLTALVTAYQAATPQLWRDELATWSAARRPVPEIFALGQHIDGVTVPYYLLVHGTIALVGDSPVALRLPSLVAMTAAAACTALLARRLWGPFPALLAGLLFAVLPVISRYAQEARGYALAMCFAALATLLLLRARDKGGWTAYGLSVAALGLAHQLALLILLGHAGRKKAWLAAVLPAVAVVVPFTLLGLGQRDRQLDWLSRADLTTLANFPETLFLSGVLGGAVCALAVVASHRRLLLTAVLPVLVLFAVDQLITPMFVGRYLLFVVPLLVALAGRGLALLRPVPALVVLIVLALIGLPVQNDIRRTHSPFDYRGAAAVIHAGAREGDAIVYAPRDGWQFTDIGLRYYLGNDLPDDALRVAGPEENDSLWATECPDPAACLTADRVWTLSADNLETGRRAGVTDQLTTATQAVLARSYRQLQVTRIEGFTIALFVRS
ncbi:glycosyltransferase family 39 protein [Symbioplanes lichenis]|uniref:glycosyltransferase family 39 protein n=1 Tax=Symbioplanes lichenis TaxID=1629072 RepID=UPI00273A5321|nr:glycosyltransferase family 39 protein [Actinoplanes lichenis]